MDTVIAGLTSDAAAVVVGVAGLVVGLGLALLHATGWYRRPGDPPHGWPGPRVVQSLVVVMTTLSWTLLTRRATGHGEGGTHLVVSLAVALVVSTVFIALAAIDLAVRRLPDVLTLPCAAAAFAAPVAVVGSGVDHGPALTGLVCGAALPAAALLLTLTVGGLGLGDVKLCCPVGVVLGWHGTMALATGLLTAVALAGATALALLLTGRADRDTPLPLGPFLAAGTLVGVLAC